MPVIEENQCDYCNAYCGKKSAHPHCKRIFNRLQKLKTKRDEYCIEICSLEYEFFLTSQKKNEMII